MSDPRVKKEPTTPAAAAAAGSAAAGVASGPSTTIGGAQKVSFAPRIPVRRKAAGEGLAASAQAGSELRDLITPKVEKKFTPRTSAQRPGASSNASAVRVAFQPASGPGGSAGGSVAAGEDNREVARIVTHQAGVKVPGQHVEPEGGNSAGEKKPRVKKEGTSAAADGSVTVEDAMDTDADALEASAEAELSEMLARENAYDHFLDNGDARQYRPILLPFPRVRLGAQGAAEHARSAAASPQAARPSSAFGAATSMFDVADDSPPATQQRASAASAAATAAAPYKALPLGSPARLLGQIDHEEKMSGGIPQPGARNILFFQFPSHLPFKQAPTWTPPVNPLLSLNGFRQSSMGSSSSAISFGANTNDVSHLANQAATRHVPTGPVINPHVSGSSNNLAAPSPSLQALHALSSPALPPLHAGLGMPGLSLGSAATTGTGNRAGGAGVSANQRAGGSSAHGGHSSGLMDDVGTSSALATEEEQDLGEIGKADGKVRMKKAHIGLNCVLASAQRVHRSSVACFSLCKISESERLAREHKARQQRKLLLFSSNFGTSLSTTSATSRPRSACRHECVVCLTHTSHLLLTLSFLPQSMRCATFRVANWAPS